MVGYLGFGLNLGSAAPMASAGRLFAALMGLAHV